MQYVSSTPATRLDVINLQEQLDYQLQARQARETGICPIREELYAQCFGKYRILLYATFAFLNFYSSVALFLVDKFILYISLKISFYHFLSFLPS